jgi:hypothetical protein
VTLTAEQTRAVDQELLPARTAIAEELQTVIG